MEGDVSGECPGRCLGYAAARYLPCDDEVLDWIGGRGVAGLRDVQLVRAECFVGGEGRDGRGSGERGQEQKRSQVSCSHWVPLAKLYSDNSWTRLRFKSEAGRSSPAWV